VVCVSRHCILSGLLSLETKYRSLRVSAITQKLEVTFLTTLSVTVAAVCHRASLEAMALK
jgi:hypothetical protein